MFECKDTFTHFDSPLGEKLDSNGTCLKLPEKLPMRDHIAEILRLGRRFRLRPWHGS